MFIIFFFISFFIDAAEESLHQINTLLSQHAYEAVYFTGTAEIRVENYVKMKTKSKTMKASDVLYIRYNDIWHNQPFTISEGEHDIKMQWTITIGADKPVKVAYLRKILSGSFYYTACEDNAVNVLHVSVSQTPITRFLMIEQFDMVAASRNLHRVPHYVEYFKGITSIDHSSVQLSYDQLLHRCQNIAYDTPFQIPLIMHTIWITNPQIQKSPMAECFNMHKRTMDVCEDWQQIFWVHHKNDHPALSASPANCPEADQKIIVRELSELFNDKRVIALKPFYEYALWIKNYGRASDVARIAILYIYGGAYRDTDFEFLQDPKKLNQACTFYAGFEDSCHSHLNNSMIASTAGHAILQKMIEIIGNPFSLPQDKMNPVHRTLFETGPFALTRAVFSCELENVGLMPYRVFNAPFAERGYMPATQLGKHGHFKEWVGQ
jgi:hypothetical protein